MASINFKFALLVAFLVVIIGQGFVTDAKPIEKKEAEEEKDAPQEVAAKDSEGDSEDDDDAEDSPTRSKVQNKRKRCKSADSNCVKRQLRIKGPIRPFNSGPDYHSEGGNEAGDTESSSPEDRSPDSHDDDKDDDGGDDEARSNVQNKRVRGGSSEEENEAGDTQSYSPLDFSCDSHHDDGQYDGDSQKNYKNQCSDYAPAAASSASAHDRTSNIKESEDDSNIEKEIVEAEDKPADKESADPDKESADAYGSCGGVAPLAHNCACSDGGMTDINSGNYNHNSNDCPFLHEQIMNGCQHGCHHGCGCGCHGHGLGPSGASFNCGCSGAGHLGTYVCNETQTACSPNLQCSNICGNINMGLPHPECQQCTSQQEALKDAQKTYCPSCKLININGNVGLSLPHPCIQLSDKQRCSSGSALTCGCECGQPGGCCSSLCAGGRDDIKDTVAASADQPASINEEKANETNATGAAKEEVKHPAKRFDHHSDEVDEDEGEDNGVANDAAIKRSLNRKNETGGRRDCCDRCDDCYLYHGNEEQIVGCACQGTECHAGGNLARVLPHPDEQLNGHYYPGSYDSECQAHGCGHIHNALPHHIQEEMNCGCHSHHGHRCPCDCCHHGHHHHCHCHDNHGHHGHCCHHDHDHHGDCCCDHHEHHGHHCCHHDCRPQCSQQLPWPLPHHGHCCCDHSYGHCCCHHGH